MAGGGRVAARDARPARRAGSLAERARLNATRALRKAIHRIAAHCPRLGRHLSNSVETGRICCYREDPTYPVAWRIEAGAAGERALGERVPGDRAPGDRAPGARVPGDRAPGEE
ncbi:MAG: hypothetical protein FJ148_27680 [Deltaproteobacteria bacterium]|nr:hypothetical protein [Deltaproteobacteria bacterium]